MEEREKRKQLYRTIEDLLDELPIMDVEAVKDFVEEIS